MPKLFGDSRYRLLMAFVNAILDMSLSSSSENDGPGLDSDSDPELETDSLSRTSWADKSLESVHGLFESICRSRTNPEKVFRIC